MTPDPARDAEGLIRGDLREITPYEPIAPLDVLSECSGVPVEELIKLDGNENPYGCSPRVHSALSKYLFYHIYPDPLHTELQAPLEKYVGVGREYIVAGSGSDELIDLVLRVFLEPGDKVINCVPTFGMYPFSTAVCGGVTVSVPRSDAYKVDITGVKSAVDDRTKVIFIASPNNPTGNVIPESDLMELMDTGAAIVIDEAYFEFSGKTFALLVTEYPNLIVLRSFSKWAGLGGLRAGYGILPLKIAEIIRRIKIPYNVNIAAMIAVRESLADIDYLRGNVTAIVNERERLSTRLKEQGVLTPLPSEANFILCGVARGDAREIKRELESKGIFIRYFDTPLLRNMLRISVGKPEHTDALIGALAKWEGG
ncbi:MAG: histidinol-phosphate transaminase [Dehalococcoidia bacterium]|nr:MAG: histidinol-phosphate transaminase [Dehalococcoidia bacterium]